MIALPTSRVRSACLLGLCLLAGAIASAEQVETVTLMRGTPHQTTCTIKRGANPGPTVFIIGGMHGDETAGYLAARKLLDWTITTGTLILIPDSHASAIRAGKREYPANMNKQFPGDPQGTMMQRAAHEIWSLIKEHQPALLVTLHESRTMYCDDRSAFGQTLTYDFKELTPVFSPVIEEINRQLPHPRHRFHLKVYPLRGCPTDCAWRFLKIPAVTIETTRTMPLAERVRQQLLVCGILMARWGLQWEHEASLTTEAAPGVPAPELREAGVVTITTPHPVAVTGALPGFDSTGARRHVAQLASVIGRRPAGSAAERQAIQYAATVLGDLGYDPQVQSVPIWQGLTSQNVFAELPGSGEVVVIGAHADSVAWSPGANDNASGVAAVLELARLLPAHTPRPTIRFMVFGAEEGRYLSGESNCVEGRAGSRSYVRNLTEAQRQQIKLMINLDQVAGGPGLRVGDMSDQGGMPVQACLRIARDLDIPLTFITFAGRSDYRPFHDRGIPVASFDCGRDPLTHKASDTPEKLDYTKMGAIVRVVVEYLRRL